jgi:hypothetical protein
MDRIMTTERTGTGAGEKLHAARAARMPAGDDA